MHRDDVQTQRVDSHLHGWGRAWDTCPTMASDGQPWPRLDLGCPASRAENCTSAARAARAGTVPAPAGSHAGIFSFFCMKHILLVNKKFNMGEK